MRFIKPWTLLLGTLWILTLTSCENYKQIAYFQDLPDSAKLNLAKPAYSELKIRPDDILSITIQLIDPTGNLLFSQSSAANNTSVATAAAGAGTGAAPIPQSPVNGYLVNKDGDIELPVLGKFHLDGLTTLQAQTAITTKAAEFYKGATVYVRFANFKVTVLGEVARPGTFILPNEKVTIFDALGLAGDLTIFGKRENVLLVRDSANQNQLVRINLNSKDIVKSDYYYLQKNDVLYVEPKKEKLANLDASKNRYFTIAAAVLSVLIIVGTRIK